MGLSHFDLGQDEPEVVGGEFHLTFRLREATGRGRKEGGRGRGVTPQQTTPSDLPIQILRSSSSASQIHAFASRES